MIKRPFWRRVALTMAILLNDLRISPCRHNGGLLIIMVVAWGIFSVAEAPLWFRVIVMLLMLTRAHVRNP